MKSLHCQLAMLFAVTAAAGAGQACYGQAFGYERWTDHTDTWTLFNQPASTLYANTWLDPFVWGGGYNGDNNYRAVDIEYRGFDAQLNQPRFDVMMVDNTGAFQQESWLVHSLTKEEVQLYGLLPNMMILDVERQGSKYAIILVRNPSKHPWQLVLDATYVDLEKLTRDGWRPVDVDTHQTVFWKGRPKHDSSRFNAVLVWNGGIHYRQFKFEITNVEAMDNDAGQGWQPVDFEFLTSDQKHFWPNADFVNVAIKNNVPFNLRWGQDVGDVLASQPKYGRIVDLEGTSFFNLHTLHILP